METQGLITKSEISVGGREKLIYHITENGKITLVDWLKEEQVHNELRYETLLKLFFGGAGERDVSIHNIEVFEEQIRKDLIVLKRYQETLEKAVEVEDHVYYLLTTSFGIETYEAYLRWCAKAKKMLKNYYKT